MGADGQPPLIGLRSFLRVSFALLERIKLYSVIEYARESLEKTPTPIVHTHESINPDCRVGFADGIGRGLWQRD